MVGCNDNVAMSMKWWLGWHTINSHGPQIKGSPMGEEGGIPMVEVGWPRNGLAMYDWMYGEGVRWIKSGGHGE